MGKRSTHIRKKRIHIFLYTALTVFFLSLNNSGGIFAGDVISKSFPAEAEEAPWQISAESLVFKENEGLYIAKGDVTFTKGDQSLHAQEAVYNEKTGIVEVSGNVRFESFGDVLTGESGVFDLNRRTGKISEGRLFLTQNHYYISGESMEKIGEDTYLIHNFRLTTCDGPNPVWSITGYEIKVTMEGYGQVKRAAFRVKDIPFIYLPYLIFPAKTSRQTGLLLPRTGYSDRNGFDLEVPFFWAISDQTDATFYERFMSRRGLMQGFEYRYVSGYDSRGIYLFDILRDRVATKDLSNADQLELSPYPRTNKSRFWLRSRTDQQLPGGVRARLDTDIVSDQDYLKEFSSDLFGFKARPELVTEFGRPLEEINSPTRRSALRLSRDRQDYSLQTLAAYYQRPEDVVDDETPQPLAGLDFTVLPRLVTGLPLSFALDTNYDFIWRDFGQKGHTLSVSPMVSYPARFGPYLEFEPSVGFTRDIQWLENNPDMGFQTRGAYQLQGRLTTILDRIYETGWKQVKKMKHKFSPTLTYRYRVYEEDDKYRPWFEPMDAEGDINRLTLSIDNLLDVKKEDDKGNITYAQWGSMSINQGYNLDESCCPSGSLRKQGPFEPLAGILTFMPFPDLKLNAEAHWDHYENAVSYADLSFGFMMERSGGRKDTYEIDYTYLRDGSKGLGYYVDINLLYGFSAGTSLRRDIDLGQNIERSYWIEHTSQCWGIRLGFEKIDEESNIMVTFRLLGLGDLSGS